MAAATSACHGPCVGTLRAELSCWQASPCPTPAPHARGLCSGLPQEGPWALGKATETEEWPEQGQGRPSTRSRTGDKDRWRGRERVLASQPPLSPGAQQEGLGLPRDAQPALRKPSGLA